MTEAALPVGKARPGRAAVSDGPMLKPRPARVLETRDRTPGSSWTRQLRMCLRQERDVGRLASLTLWEQTAFLKTAVTHRL